MKQFQLANSGLLRDRLVAAVLSGNKTATSSLLNEWQVEKEEFPSVGEQQALIDSNGENVGIIEITSIEQRKLSDVDDSIAHDEGENFKDVTGWRKVHESYWLADKYQPSAQEWQLSDDTIVVVERFKLLKKL